MEKQFIQVLGAKNVNLPANTITKIPLTMKNSTSVGLIDKVFDIEDGGLRCLYTGMYIIWGSVYFNSPNIKDVGIYLKKSRDYKNFDTAVEILSRRNGSGLQGAMTIGPFLTGIQDGDTIYLCGRAIGEAGKVELGNPTVTFLGAWRITL